MSEHERIWLEPAPGADEEYGRQWCQHNVWGDDATEYVHAEIVAAKDAEIAKLREAVLSVVVAVRDHLPPDGIDEQTFISRVIQSVDNPTINPFIATAERDNGRS